VARNAEPVQSHQRTRPAFSQKCDRQPFWSQTDDDKLGRLLLSTVMSERGLASAITSSSIIRPQPQGQRMPTH
jgi:hypothetical protein